MGRRNQSPRSGGDQPSSQGHDPQSGSSSTAQSTKAESMPGCLDTDHKQLQRESTTSFQGHLSFPGTLPKEKNGGYLKAKDLTVQARASFNLIVMAHWLTHHHRAYVHKHIHRFPGNIPGSLDFSRTENTLLRYPLQLSKVAGCLFYAVLYSLPSNPDIIDWAPH